MFLGGSPVRDGIAKIGGDGLAISKVGPPTDQFVPTCGG
jgi:hypothetical protein